MIYFIGDGEYIKIGYTGEREADMPFRLSALQIGHPKRLSVLAVVDGDKRREKRLHNYFAALRVRGEWFLGSSSLMLYVAFLKKERRYIPPGEFFEVAAAPDDKAARWARVFGLNSQIPLPLLVE